MCAEFYMTMPIAAGAHVAWLACLFVGHYCTQTVKAAGGFIRIIQWVAKASTFLVLNTFTWRPAQLPACNRDCSSNARKLQNKPMRSKVHTES